MSKRILRPGQTSDGDVFVTVEFDGKRLSISGVEGPKWNGDARGGCGQIVDALDRLMDLAPGWTPDTVKRLRAEWERWHLNDMRAGCEHQRKEGWDTRPIDPTKPLNAYGTFYPGQHQPSWNMATWVSRAEWEGGLLSEPCDVCGYKYGTAWRSETVPVDVMAFLGSLPAADKPLPRSWAA